VRSKVIQKLSVTSINNNDNDAASFSSSKEGEEEKERLIGSMTAWALGRIHVVRPKSFESGIAALVSFAFMPLSFSLSSHLFSIRLRHLILFFSLPHSLARKI
jgi:hypothetical protein